jgi:hypothetical protein
VIIRNFGTVKSHAARVYSGTVSWEDRDFPERELIFEIGDGGHQVSVGHDEPCADAFLVACFPLAAVHGERRVRIDGGPCPMLVEGLFCMGRGDRVT